MYIYFIKVLVLHLLFIYSRSEALLDKVIESSTKGHFDIVTYGLSETGTIELTIGNIELSFRDAPGDLKLLAFVTETLSQTGAIIDSEFKHETVCSKNDVGLSVSNKNIVHFEEFSIPNDASTWEHVFMADESSQGWWNIYLYNCKDSVSANFWVRSNAFQRLALGVSILASVSLQAQAACFKKTCLYTNFYAVKSIFLCNGIDSIAWNVEKFTSIP
ncbi:hypothetical protein BB560_002734, partial [Smittium megazygosporum]